MFVIESGQVSRGKAVAGGEYALEKMCGTRCRTGNSLVTTFRTVKHVDFNHGTALTFIGPAATHR